MHERRRCATTSCEPLAQLVEHRPFKPRVVGSIPTRLTLKDLIVARQIGGPFGAASARVFVRKLTATERRFSVRSGDGVAEIIDGEVTIR